MKISPNNRDEGYIDSTNQRTKRKALKINQVIASNEKMEVLV
jgi:hypothetical protein